MMVTYYVQDCGCNDVVLPDAWWIFGEVGLLVIMTILALLLARIILERSL
jgi:hypothetical protein